MSIFGDLSKPQRELLTKLFHRPAGTAVSIDTAVRSSVNPRLVHALAGKCLVEFRHIGLSMWSREFAVWLTPAGLEVMRNLDFRHSHGRDYNQR